MPSIDPARAWFGRLYVFGLETIGNYIQAFPDFLDGFPGGGDVVVLTSGVLGMQAQPLLHGGPGPELSRLDDGRALWEVADEDVLVTDVDAEPSPATPSHASDDEVDRRPAERRLRGRARQPAEALREYWDHTHKRRAAINKEWRLHPRLRQFMMDLHAPDPDKLYRWRIELDCGCIHEVLTSGKDRLPSDTQWRQSLDKDPPLPAGQYDCRHDDDLDRFPFRPIAEWGDRKDDRPAQPIEPPADWTDGPEFWARYRRDRPWAVWSVTLDCGHMAEIDVKDISWNPADGPVRREVSPDELAEELARLKGRDVQGFLADVDAHNKRWWIDGRPEPRTETLCFRCTSARRIVAYESVGWLAKPRREAGLGALRSLTREGVKRRLQDAEREVAELRSQLSRLEATELAPPRRPPRDL